LKLRGDYLAIVTLGFGEIVRIFMNNLNAPINITNGPQGITLIDPVAFGGFKFSGTRRCSADPERAVKYYYLLVALAILVIIINLRLQHSRIGRAWQAIREDESPPRRSASIPATSSCWRSPWAPASAVSPAACSPPCRASCRRKAFR
jgi:ABC-type branched-subunit amino acid transport system permease subunit